MAENKQQPGLDYVLGTERQQGWQKKYFLTPRGLSSFESGAVPMDHPSLSAYNIAKSSYQIRPDVFNMGYLSKETGQKKEEIIKRMQRLYSEHLIMYVMNPPVQIMGFGLYWWAVKMKEGTPKETKQKLAEWFQNKDEICTGAETDGEFDFLNGCHMRVLDNLLHDIIFPVKNLPEVEYVHMAPVRRVIREAMINMWDAQGDSYRELFLSDKQIEKLVKVQNKMDFTDLKIFQALNKKRPMEEVYDFKVLNEISGLDPREMLEGIKDIVEKKRLLVPLFYLNPEKLGLTNHVFLIRFFQTAPTYVKSMIADQISAIPELNQVNEFTDSYYDVLAGAFNEISDIEAIRNQIGSSGEVEEIKEADIVRDFRRWTCRLDDKAGMWEECVFTDDFLLDKTSKKMPEIHLAEKNKEAE